MARASCRCVRDGGGRAGSPACALPAYDRSLAVRPQGADRASRPAATRGRAGSDETTPRIDGFRIRRRIASGGAAVAAEDAGGLRERLLILARVADALEHAHRQGVVHRDVKPGNFLVRHDGHPFLIDFGLARNVSVDGTITSSQDVMGTPVFMSPEQIRGDAEQVDHRTDVWSLGATLFAVVTGRLPFEALRSSALQAARAWARKEIVMGLWWKRRREEIRDAWQRWCRGAARSRLGPVIKVVAMMRSHLEGIVNAIEHQVSNARAESINARIQWVKRMTNGFRNTERFKLAIDFHLGGLAVRPALRFHPIP